MSFSAAIQAMIGADISDLKTKGAQVEGLAGKMSGALGQIGVGLSFGAVTAFFAKVADHAGKVQDLSDRLGVGTDALQAFQYRAEQAGVGADQAAGMWDKARKAISQLVAGEKEMVDSFSAIGLAQKDLIGIPLEQQVEKIAKAYSSAKGEAGAYDAVTDILGSKTAPKLMAVIQELADQGLPAFTASAREAGQVIDTETIAKLDEMGDRIATLKGAATTAGAVILDKFVQLGEGLGYVAAAIANEFEGIGTDWAVAAQKAEKSATEQVAAITKVMAKTQALARMEQTAFDRVTASLPVKERIIALEDKALQLRLEATNAGKGTAEWAEKEARSRELFAQAAKLGTEEQRKLNLGSEEQIELARLALAAKRGLTIVERERRDILSLQSQQLKLQAELAPLIEKGYANLNPKERVRFDELVKQGDKLKEQITTKEGIIAKTKEQLAAEGAVGKVIAENTEEVKRFFTSITRTGREDTELSPRELARKIRNLEEGIARTQRGTTDTTIASYLTQPQRIELQQARAEQTLRQQVNARANQLGEDRAFQMFDLSESRFRQIRDGYLADSEKMNRTLEKLERGIEGLNENLRARPRV